MWSYPIWFAISVLNFFTPTETKTHITRICVFRAISFDLHGSENLSNNTLHYYKLFSRESGHDAIDFPGVSSEEIPLVEKSNSGNLNLYSLCYNEEGLLIGELSRRKAWHFENEYLWFNTTTTCAGSATSTLSWKTSDVRTATSILQKSSLLNRHLQTSDDKVKHTYPNGPYNLRESTSDKLEDVNIHVEEVRRLFQILAVRLWSIRCTFRNKHVQSGEYNTHCSPRPN